jgi:hypothetical protein
MRDELPSFFRVPIGQPPDARDRRRRELVTLAKVDPFSIRTPEDVKRQRAFRDGWQLVMVSVRPDAYSSLMC